MTPPAILPALVGRVAIVTGGGRGLGKATTLALAQAGVRVIASAAKSPAELSLLAQADPDAIIPVEADVTDPGDCIRVVRTVLQRFGRLDILVNNAGCGMKYVSEDFLTVPTRFWAVEPETWRIVIDTNVNGPFLMARAAVPVMRGGGLGAHHQHLDES